MIARALEISDGTVKLHVKAILRKLGMRSRVEAAVSRGRARPRKEQEKVHGPRPAHELPRAGNAGPSLRTPAC